jgi:ABC-type amino acid transport substrate-binding protein
MNFSKTLRFALSCAFLQATSDQDDPLVLKTAIMETAGFAERNADGEWTGVVIDVANALVEKAAADGVTLLIEIDTVNGVLSDTMTYNEALTTLDPDCTGDVCYDMILADCKCFNSCLSTYISHSATWSNKEMIQPSSLWEFLYYLLSHTFRSSLVYDVKDFHTSDRSQIVTFPQPYAIAYMTTFKTSAGAYNSLEEANAGGGSVCIPTGTATLDSLNPITNTVVECDDNDDCIVKLKAGECDLWAADNLLGPFILGDDTDIIGTGDVLLDIFWLTNALKRYVGSLFAHSFSHSL